MIYINGIPSIGKSDSGDDLDIDDRKEEIKLINGTTYQKGGVFLSGIQLSCVFDKNNFNLLLPLWLSDTAVSYTDKRGKTHTGFTIKVDKIKPLDNFYDYVRLDFKLVKEQRTPLSVNDYLVT